MCTSSAPRQAGSLVEIMHEAYVIELAQVLKPAMMFVGLISDNCNGCTFRLCGCDSLWTRLQVQ